MAEGLEVGELVGVHGEPGAALDQVVHLGPLGRHRRALVEGHLVDAEVLAEVREQADQRFADRSGADDVDDPLHREVSCALWNRTCLRDGRKDTMRSAFRQPEAGDVSGRLRSVSFPGPAGALEGLWKEAAGERRGTAVFAHPHPLHGGTMHNKVVYRAVQALTRSGFATLRFNFRGVGLSEGRYDAGRGEVDDYRAALDEAERDGGLPLVAGGFSFGSAVALKAIVGDRRVAAVDRPGSAARDGIRPPRAAPDRARALRRRTARHLRLARGSRSFRKRIGESRGPSGRGPLLRGQSRRCSAESSTNSSPPCPLDAPKRARGPSHERCGAVRRGPGRPAEARARHARGPFPGTTAAATDFRPGGDVRRAARPLRDAAPERSTARLHRHALADRRPDARRFGVRAARGVRGPAFPAARGAESSPSATSRSRCSRLHG